MAGVSTADTHSESVELHLVRRATDLWPAIESAQFGRIVDIDPAMPPPAQAAIMRFLESFGRCTEGWEAMPDHSKTALFAGLESRLNDIAAVSCGVYAGTARRTVRGEGGTVSMPIAVLRIGRALGPALVMRIPLTLGAADES